MELTNGKLPSQKEWLVNGKFKKKEIDFSIEILSYSKNLLTWKGLELIKIFLVEEFSVLINLY